MAQAFDYPDFEAALNAASSQFGATHIVIHGESATIYSPTSKGYERRTLSADRGFFHWPKKGDLVDSVPENAKMLLDVIDVGFDPDVAPRPRPELRPGLMPTTGRRAYFGEEADDRWARHKSRPSVRVTHERYVGEDRPGWRGSAKENPATDLQDAIPWIRVTRDPERWKESLARARQIGPVDDARKVYDLVGPALIKEDQECFVVVLIDVRQNCRGVAEIHRGARSRVATSVLDVMRIVVAAGAEGFIVVHNHPSGKAMPSSADRSLTKAIERAAKPFQGETTFLDHVVIGAGEFYSFAENKLHRARN